MARRFQFSLRALIVFTTICALSMAAVASLGLEFLSGLTGFFWACVFVSLLPIALIPLEKLLAEVPDWTCFIHAPILHGLLASAFYLFGEAVDGPLSTDRFDFWLRCTLADCALLAPIVAAVSLFLVAVDYYDQAGGPRDTAFFPQFSGVRRALRLPGPRMLLIVGTSLVLGLYAMTIADPWTFGRPGAIRNVSPNRVFATCCLLWSLLWFAECRTRPRNETMASAGFFLCAGIGLMTARGFPAIH